MEETTQALIIAAITDLDPNQKTEGRWRTEGRRTKEVTSNYHNGSKDKRKKKEQERINGINIYCFK